MRKELIQYIVCPECKKELTFEGLNYDIVNGLLYCSELHYYPVIRNVPVLIKNVFLEKFLNQYERKEFYRVCDNIRINLKSSNEKNPEIELMRKNYLNWSLEWNTYNFEETIWGDERTFLGHIPLDTNKLNEYKRVLEIGCGRGRNIKHTRTKDNLVFAIDISESAYIANKKYEKDKNVFVVRADAMCLPFKDDFFDFVFSDHVLQHINDLNLCFKEVRRVSMPQNRFIFNLYSKENNGILTKYIEPFKKNVLNKLSINSVHFLSNIPALILWVIIKGIYSPLDRHCKNLYKILPLSQHMTLWFSFEYKILRQTCFDLLHAPVVYYFSANDIEKLSRYTALVLDKKYLLRQTLWICSGRFRK